MVKKNYFLLFFIIFLSTLSLLKVFNNAVNLDTYEYGEWLINYQSGFIRRGLSGEIIFQLSKIFNSNLQLAYFVILSVICLMFYRLNYILLKNIKFNFFTILVLFSPLLYFFFIIINGVGIRKEILLFVFYLWYLINISSRNFNNNDLWKFIFIFPVLLFIHEGIFFYLPYIFLPILLIKKKEEYKNFIPHFSVLIFTSILSMIIIYFFNGSEKNTFEICQSLKTYTPIGCLERGPIFALKNDILKDQANNSMLFFYLDASFISWLGYLIYVIYSFIPLILLFKFAVIKNKFSYIIIYFFIIIFSLPLFHVAEDWSRWFSIHIHLTVFLIFFLQNNKIIKYKISINSKKINDFFMKKKVLFFLLLFSYCTLFHHEEYFSKDTKLELTYYKIFSEIN